MRFSNYFLPFILAFLLLGCGASNDETDNTNTASSSQASEDTVTTGSEKLVVYSARKEPLIKPLFDLYTEKTGVKIEFITDSAGPLLTRLQSEQQTTPADVLLTVDAGNLWQATNLDVLQEVESTVLTDHVPAYLRDEKNRWFGLSIRARTLVYSTQRVDPSELSTYEQLSESKWKGRLCLRTSKKVYNQSLVATMIHRLGEATTESIVKGWVDNLATDVFSNDTKTMEAIVAGQCDVAIVNTYYFGQLQKDKPDVPLAIFWPNQDSNGVHINVSGAGVTRFAKNPQRAKDFIEWLTSSRAQELFASLNQEYPVLDSVPPSPEVAKWGRFKQDNVALTIAGKLQEQAIRLMDRVGYR